MRFKKSTWVTASVILIIVALLQWSFITVNENEYQQQKLEAYLSKSALDFTNELEKLKALAGSEKANSHQLVEQFKACRISYKKLEGFTGYYFAYTERDLNGPPIAMVEEEPQSKYVRPPHGLQVIEEIITEKPLNKKRLLDEVNHTLGLASKLSLSFKTLHPYDYQLFEIMQLRLVKIYTLGINNFDCQVIKTGISETKAALLSISNILNISYRNADFSMVNSSIDSAVAFLDRQQIQVNHGAEFDYFTFYRNYVVKVNQSLINARKSILKFDPQNIRALNLDAATLFEKEAYNTYFFTKLQRSINGDMLPYLGKLLFFDPILSVNNSVSCASCHKPNMAYTDGLPKSYGFLKNDTLPRNTPTILNAALQRNLFMDASVLVLEDQAKTVVQNEREMHGDFKVVVAKLNQSSAYKKIFSQAFAGTKDTAISEEGILKALAEFQRTQLSFDSPFDKAMRGAGTVAQPVIDGYNIFMGKAKCGHCHFAGLFNGTTPPQYRESEFDIIGVPSSNKRPYKLDGDLGRYNVFKNDELKYAFKTTTVRNIAVTAPYMHNGVYKTLEEVVDFYNKGGGAGLGIHVPDQTLPEDKLKLTKDEKKKLVLFLQALTDTSAVVHFSGQLPAIDDSASPLNKRIAGGTD